MRNKLFEQALLSKPSPSGAPGPMSRSELADAVNAELARRGIMANLTDKDIGRYVRGETHWPRAHYRQALRAVLGVSHDRELGFYPNRRRRQPGETKVSITSTASPAAATLEWDGRDDEQVSEVDRRGFLSVVAATALGISGDSMASVLPSIEIHDEPLRRIGMGDAERVEASTRAFRDLDRRWGGGGVSRGAAMAQLRWVLDSAKTAVFASDAVRTRFLSAAADLAGVAGFMCYDVERHDEARRLWLTALDACREAGNAGLAGATLRCLAHQSLHLKRPDEALGLVGMAYSMAVGGGYGGAHLAQAETAAYQGWCYAMAGDEQACRHALELAEEQFEKAVTDDVPEWLAYFNEAELNGLRGNALRLLGRHVPAAALEAQPLLRQALEARPAPYARSRTLDLIALSISHVQAGDDLEEAVAVGREALAGARTLTSRRSLVRLRELEQAIAPFAGTHAEVAELHQQVTDAIRDASRSSSA